MTWPHQLGVMSSIFVLLQLIAVGGQALTEAGLVFSWFPGTVAPFGELCLLVKVLLQLLSPPVTLTFCCISLALGAIVRGAVRSELLLPAFRFG